MLKSKGGLGSMSKDMLGGSSTALIMTEMAALFLSGPRLEFLSITQGR